MTATRPGNGFRPEAAGRSARILIAEDEGLLAEELRDRLESMGHQVVEVVDSGEEAIRCAEQTAPDLILMDIRLKGQVDGVEAAARIGEGLGTPLIYLTAHSDDATLRRAKGTCPLGYLIKPVRERDLRVTVEMALQRAELERRLRESESRFETTLRSIGDAVIATDAGGRVTFLNPVAEALTGWSQADAIGRPLDLVFRLIDSETRAPRASPVRQAIDDQQIVNLPDHTHLVARDGTEVPIDDSAAPIRDSLRVGGAVVVFRDISERLRAEALARKAEEELRQAHKMEAIGRLAGGFAHDINNMMTAVIGFGELALQHLPADHPVRGMVEEMKRAGDRAAAFTRQLLSFSRKQVVFPTSLDLNEVVAGMTRLLGQLIGPDVTIQTRLQPGVGAVTADRGQLEQVVMNLALNARDAMPRGGDLTLATADVHVDPGSPRGHQGIPPGDYVVLAVTDTGYGMDAVTLSHVFEPFFTTKERGRGTGLGLATVHGAVKQAGGDIRVESELGRGSTFTAYFPRGHSPARPGAGGPPPELPGGFETILLVDDDAGVRRMTRELLLKLGYRVIEAADGQDAIYQCDREAGPIDLLLTDAIMPGLSGRAVAERVIAVRPGTRVLFMSGYTEDQILRHEIRVAEVSFLPKPFSIGELANSVRRVLDNKPAGAP